jgi:hypothetical protein
MSNGDQWTTINAAFESENTFLESLSDATAGIAAIIAFVQPYAAAALAIISLAEKLIQLNQPDPTLASLAQIQAALDDLFAKLNASEAGQTLLERNTTLNGYLAHATTALDNLQNAHDDPSLYPPADQINECVYTLEALKNNNDYVWNTTYTAQEFQKIYWTDAALPKCDCNIYGGGYRIQREARYGTQSPPLNSDGATVFDYRCSLPLYLDAVSIFLAVGGALDPNFLDHQSGRLKDAASVLLDKYNQIKSGITTLAPPDWTSVGLINAACPSPISQPNPPGMRLVYDTFTPGLVVGGMLEYGAVEKFSGVSSVSSTYQIDLTNSVADWNQALYNKLQLRLLRRTRDVFAKISLGRLRQTIDQLNALVGNPAMPKPTFTWQDGSVFDMTDWSFRQIMALVKLPAGANGFSLRALAAFIIKTQPFDTPYTNAFANVPVSFTDLLTNFTD